MDKDLVNIMGDSPEAVIARPTAEKMTKFERAVLALKPVLWARPGRAARVPFFGCSEPSERTEGPAPVQTPPPLKDKMIFYHWLSFVDPDRPKGQRFLGICIVKTFTQSVTEAVGLAHMKGINPGGEVRDYLLESAPDMYCNVLVTEPNVIKVMGDQCVPYRTEDL